MIKHSVSPIKEPLLAYVPPNLAKQAVDCFLHAMKYMGDYPVKKYKPLKFVQRFAQTGLDEPKLRDELFTQLIKQTNGNIDGYANLMLSRQALILPARQSLLRGWELISICCGLFLPTRLLVYHLVAYLQYHAHYQCMITGEDKASLTF